MTPLAPPRFAEGPAMLLAGVRRHHTFADAARTVPAQWEAARALLPLAGQQGTTEYGAVCGTAPAEGRFEYLAGVEVASFDGLPPEVGRMRVPAQWYAVFEHRGPVEALAATWDAIWNAWVPRSGVQPANTPDFERYAGGSDAASAARHVEIWFPVERAPSA